MYAIKPWSQAALVGSTVGSLTLGIGMRWRETVVDIIDRHENPSFETKMMKRCIVSEHGFRVLEDLGCNTDIIKKEFTPAKKWKICTPDLHVIREGHQYPGCSPAEPVYTTTEGKLQRALRREFLRYGGHFTWGSNVYEPYANPENKDNVCLAKDFGPLTNAEAIICFAKNHPQFEEVVFSPEGAANRQVALFQVKSGVCETPLEDLLVLFGHDYDFAIAMGKQMALHIFRVDASTFSWRLVTSPQGDNNAQDNVELLHPAVRHMMAKSKNVISDTLAIPAETPIFSEDLIYQRISIMGDALLPVDPFEWRGDNAMTAIENAAELTQALYKKKFFRGHVPSIFREAETDQLMRRADLLRRDMRDAEMFLADHPQLDVDDDDAEPQLRRVGQ